MTSLRPAELAGTYYPSTEHACRTTLEGYPPLAGPDGQALAALVPHGGWRYAGRLTAGTLQALRDRTESPDLLVVVGGHLEPDDPVRILIEGDWDTPLGVVPNPQALAEAVAIPLSAEPETAEEYYDDNAVEVLMPMLRWLWPEVPALVVGVAPNADPGPIAREIAEQCSSFGFARPRVVGSVDLTHYGPDYRFRPRGSGPTAHRWVLEENDRSLVARFETLDTHAIVWEGTRNRSTCSPGAAAVTVALAKKLGATEGRCLARSTSWLESGEKEPARSFIGYAGVLFGTFKP